MENEAIKSEREKRIEKLQALKEEYLKLISQNDLGTNMAESDNSVTAQDTNTPGKNNANTRGVTKTYATAVGRKMADRENGFSNAFMIGLLSLFFEVAFLVLAFILYQ